MTRHRRIRGIARGGQPGWGLTVSLAAVARLTRWARQATVVVAGMGMLMPPSLLSATARAGDSAEPSPLARTQGFRTVGRQAVRDVGLDREGTLHGVILRGTGAPAVQVEVTALRQGHLVSHAVTDASGRFQIGGLHGGLWRLEGGSADGLFRVWAAGTAPPAARGEAVLRGRQPVVRGQSSQGARLTTDGVLLGAVLLGGAAVPVIVNRGGSDPPSGS